MKATSDEDYPLVFWARATVKSGKSRIGGGRAIHLWLNLETISECSTAPKRKGFAPSRMFYSEPQHHSCKRCLHFGEKCGLLDKDGFIVSFTRNEE